MFDAKPLMSVKNIAAALRAAIVGAIVMMSATSAHATVDPIQFITNGSFETTTALGQIGYNADVVGWTAQTVVGSTEPGLNFIMNTATASTTGVTGAAGPVILWGPGNGIANGLAASAGNNFLATDSDFYVGSIGQTISGLTVGQNYTLSFSYAGAQQQGYTGPSETYWNFGFASEGGASAHQTTPLQNVSQGFTGWSTKTYNFVATQTSDTLYFLAAGGPLGQPPFSLLDNVSLTATTSAAPEPSTWLIMVIGFGVVGMSLRRRATRRAAVAA